MRWIRHDYKGEKGFTLVELLVVVVLVGLIGLGASAVTVRLMKSQGISADTLAIRQVEMAGDRVSQDAQQSSAYGITLDNLTASGGFLKIEVNGYWLDTSQVYHTKVSQITYTLVPSGNRWKLFRHDITTEAHKVYNSGTKEWEDSVDKSVDSTITVAEYLDASQMTCSWDDTGHHSFTFRVVAVVSSETESRAYKVEPRIGG
jgi:prepilin-type N-terminal cleavage/methylation domain-containing protein